MLCPRCSNRQGVNKSGMKCVRCGYHFTFNPKAFGGLTDTRVLSSVRRVGRDGTVAFTPRQIYADLARRRRFVRRTLSARLGEMDRASAGITQLAARYPARFARMVAFPAFVDAGTELWPEPDVYDYGAERILVVDNALAVDLLIDAGVHMTARAIVVDVAGYPTRIGELARALVADRPGVPVGLFHESGADVAGLTERVRNLLGAPIRIDDVGLAPASVKTIDELRWARRLPSVPVDALPRWMFTVGLADAWLNGHQLGAERVPRDEKHGRDRSGGDYG